MIDQHFDQRNRYGRLLMIVSQSPQLLGIGVDEDTAAVVTDEGDRQLLRVLGRGSVTIFDPSRMVTNAYEAQRSQPAAGQRRGAARAPGGSASSTSPSARWSVQQPAVDPEDAAEIAQAQRDMRQVARDIAAGDISPGTLRRRQARSRTRHEPATHPRSGTRQDGDAR